jgi:hypothetical protein
MKKTSVLFALLIAVTVFSPRAHASTIASLANWCVNVNGNTSDACNGGGSGGGITGIDLSLFDTTLESGTNSLGSIAVTLGPGLGQSALVYMDYDLNYDAVGSFQDFGSVVGANPADMSFEMDDPNLGFIEYDFTNNVLDNTNYVPTGSGPPDACCDVAWALGVNVDVPVSAVVTYTVSTTAPGSGFYLQQTSLTGGDIYLSASVSQAESSATPEPATFGLMIAGGLLVAWKKKFRAVQ